MTRDEIQADAETQVIPREVADRLAEALQRCRSSLEFEGNYTTAEIARNALDAYRKAVARGE